jgi:hypothetical protein
VVQKFRGAAGFTDEAFNMLDMKVEVGDGEHWDHLYCNVVIDEMSIRSREIWDPVNKKYHARVQVPGTDSMKSTSKASNSFLILLISVKEIGRYLLGIF